MTDHNQDKAEEFLKDFSLKPAPPELRAKILARAVQRQREVQVMTPFFWKGFLVCTVLILIFLGVDASLSKAQQNRIDSFFKRTMVSEPAQNEEWLSLGEIINNISNSKIISRDSATLLFGINRSKIRRDYNRIESLAEGVENNENEEDLY